jgi:DNA-binding PadR family transcriptional regulator
MYNGLDFSDFLNDAIRILIIASAVKDTKSINLSDQKIKLCDYYLKFPYTMFGAEIKEDAFKANFDEFYAFFHWKPEAARYQWVLNYLIAKGLLIKKLDSQVVYQITEQGLEALGKIENQYKESLVRISTMMVKEVQRLSSDTGIEKEIQKKSDLLSRRMV